MAGESVQSLYEVAAKVNAPVVVSLQAFQSMWEQRLQQTPTLEASKASDVFMVAALSRVEPLAVEWLREQVHAALVSVSGAVPQSRWADVESDMLQRLLIDAPDRPARIREYKGTGTLKAWLRVIVVRAALKTQTPVDLSGVEEAWWEALQSTATTLEVGVLHGEFRESLAPAMLAAIDALSPKDRSLLRLHYLEDVSMEALARSYRVHAASVSRWVEGARAAFLSAVRDELARRTGVGRLAVDSLVRVLQDRFDISFRRALAGAVS